MAQLGSLVLLAFVAREVLVAVGGLVTFGVVYVSVGSGDLLMVWWAMGLVVPAVVAGVFAGMLGWIALIGTQRLPSWAGNVPVTIAGIVAFCVARLTTAGLGLGQGMLMTKMAMRGVDVEAFYMAQSSGWMVGQAIQGVGFSLALALFAFRVFSPPRESDL